MIRLILCAMSLAIASILSSPCLQAAEYYVAIGGLDTNSGAIGSPFATFSKAIGLATAGDTIFARGGTYNLSTTVSIGSSKSGTAGNPISLLAYPGEEPVLDFRGQPYNAINGGLKGISLNGSYWHIKGLTIQYAADNGMAIGGSNNIVEQVIARQNQDSGIQISGSSVPSNNLILNCDSYGNFDFGGSGENADGFAVKFRGLGSGNVISGARSYNNADDGFDFWQAENGVTVTNSWSFHNGIASTFNNPVGYLGDSNGYKLGKDSGTHILENVVAWGNDANGIDINGNATEKASTPVTPFSIPHGVQILNSTAALNGAKNFNFDENPTTASPSTQHILRNNVSYSGSVTMNTGNTADHNTFAGPGGSPAGLGATAADFISVVNPVTSNGNYHPAGTGGDRSGVTTPLHASGPALASRLADGSLPLIDFLHLAPGSHLIDAGTNVGLPFNGTAPDLGAFETSPVIVYADGDFNEDGSVDSDDLADWQTGYGTLSAADHGDGDADEDGDVDGRDFLIWQQQYAPSLTALSTTIAVPEPHTFSLLLFILTALLGSKRCHIKY